LLEQATDPTNNVLAEYSYLADGTKLAVRDKAGNGYTYLGSLIYQSNGGRLSLENTLFNGGSILKTSSGYEVVYHVTDYLGSIRAVVDSSGKVLEYNNYYPFGERWQQTGPLFAGNRYRFNGKELQVTGQLGLLDYGARMYDPALARWQGCDPAMQMANPFVFSGNNPVVNVDEDGQFFFSFLSGFIRGLIKGQNPLKTGWKGVTNTAKIVGGLFVGDFGQIISRLTWELPQTLLGYSINLISSQIGMVWDVNYYDGATVVNSSWYGHGAFTLGSYISGGHTLRADPSNPLFQHEYGHYLQSQDFGPLYLNNYAIPSLMSAIFSHKTHKHYYTEQDANKRAIKYWEKKFPGFVDIEHKWNFDINPIDVYNRDIPFSENVPSLQNRQKSPFDKLNQAIQYY